MDFYSSIAGSYDDIFPLPGELVELVLGYLPRPPAAVVDLGCSTGRLANALQGRGHQVLGLDLDPEMIRLARANASTDRLDTRFEVADLRAIDGLAERGSVDGALCFGNTLVHLPGLDDVARLARGLDAVLGPDGSFLGQIVNYDRILDLGQAGLPTIENDRIRFERRYEERPDGRLDFATTLTVKSTGAVLENRVALYPLRVAALTESLSAGGLKKVEVFAGYEGEPWSPRSFMTFWRARR